MRDLDRWLQKSAQGGKALLFHLMVKRGCQVILKGLGKDVGEANILLRSTDLAIEHVGAKDSLLLFDELFSGRRCQITAH
jgi:hypothetical protein